MTEKFWTIGDKSWPIERLDDGTSRVVEGEESAAIELWSEHHDGIGKITFYGPVNGILWNTIKPANA